MKNTNADTSAQITSIGDVKSTTISTGTKQRHLAAAQSPLDVRNAHRCDGSAAQRTMMETAGGLKSHRINGRLGETNQCLKLRAIDQIFLIGFIRTNDLRLHPLRRVDSFDCHERICLGNGLKSATFQRFASDYQITIRLSQRPPSLIFFSQLITR